MSKKSSNSGSVVAKWFLCFFFSDAYNNHGFVTFSFGGSYMRSLVSFGCFGTGI